MPRVSFFPALAGSILAGAIGIALTPPHALAQLKPASSGLINPRAIVFNPATGKVYVVGTDHGAVQIYSDASGQMRRVQVGTAPVSIAVNAANGRAYVANAGDGTVSVLDGNSDAVVATVPVGDHPYSIAANQATGKVYVTHTYGDQLSILDGATNTVAELKTGSSDLIAINDHTGTIYLLGYGGAVKVLDIARQNMVERPIGRHAWGLTMDDATGSVYATMIEDADVAALNANSSIPSSLPAGEIPCAIAINAKMQMLYVADYGDNTVSAIDAATGRKTATIAVGTRPKAIAFDPRRNLIYTANTGDNTATVIDAASYKVIATLPAGKSPYALAVVPGSNRLYVANESEDESSTVVDLSAVHVPVP